MVLADGNLFVTRRVDQAFAVAEVAGYPDIGMGLGSNVTTRTNADGVALIPNLWPYENNSVRIDPKDLPVSAEIDSIEIMAIPAWRSGVKVTFPVRGGRGALVKITFEDGEPAPAGATVEVLGDKAQFYVARRGEAFVTGLQTDNRVQLNWQGHHCVFGVTLPPASPDEIPRLGPFLCKGSTGEANPSRSLPRRPVACGSGTCECRDHLQFLLARMVGRLRAVDSREQHHSVELYRDLPAKRGRRSDDGQLHSCVQQRSQRGGRAESRPARRDCQSHQLRELRRQHLHDPLGGGRTHAHRGHHHRARRIHSHLAGGELLGLRSGKPDRAAGGNLYRHRDDDVALRWRHQSHRDLSGLDLYAFRLHHHCASRHGRVHLHRLRTGAKR